MIDDEDFAGSLSDAVLEPGRMMAPRWMDICQRKYNLNSSVNKSNCRSICSCKEEEEQQTIITM